MKGLAYIDKNLVEMIEKPRPALRIASDAIIKITAVAPCTTEVHVVENGVMDGMKGNIIGHEAVGIVEEVGSAVKLFKPGDRVVLPDVSPVWESTESMDGRPHYSPLCMRSQNPDPEIQGMFAEYVLYERADSGLALIPDCVSDEQALMCTDMVPTAATAIDYLDIKFGETVAILGIGPVGLMGVELAILSGAGRVFATGSRRACFEAARKLGATDLIDYHDGSVSEQILTKNGGQRVDKVMIAGGTSSIISEALGMCKHGGKVANVAFFLDFFPANAAALINPMNWDIELRTLQFNTNRLIQERLLAMIQYGRIHPEYLISHVFHGIDSLPEAFALMCKKSGDLIKPVVLY